jgi:tetratricopeptide (TPR) repeat protein
VLDAIPALIILLLIQNEDKEDHMSQELVRGLRTLQDKRQDQGPNSAEVASVLNFVGTILFHKNDFENALLFFQEELRLEDSCNVTSAKRAPINEQVLSVSSKADETSVSVTCNNIGRILQELNRHQEAIHFYHRALKSEYGDILQLKSKVKESSRSIARSKNSANLFSTVWYNLGLIHDKLRSYDEAIFAFEMSLELRKAMLGTDHPDIACLLYNIGVLQMEQQRLPDATTAFREALRIRLNGAAGQLNDKHVIKTLEKLASLYKVKGNCAGALATSEDILRIQLITPEFDDIKRLFEIGATLRSVSELYHATGNIEAAIKTAKASVFKFRIATDLRRNQLRADGCSGLTDISTLPNENSAEVEQLVSSLLLLGSLYHEAAEPLDAVLIFHEAAKAVEMQQNELKVHGTHCSSLNALQEVTAMLACCQCAPGA